MSSENLIANMTSAIGSAPKCIYCQNEAFDVKVLDMPDPVHGTSIAKLSCSACGYISQFDLRILGLKGLVNQEAQALQEKLNKIKETL